MTHDTHITRDTGKGCSWAHGDMSLARPRSGHCMVTVGEELVLVGGGPDNYGSTQVREIIIRIIETER